MPNLQCSTRLVFLFRQNVYSYAKSAQRAELDALQKTATIEKLLALEVDIDKIAKATDTSIDFVLDIKSKMNLSSL